MRKESIKPFVWGMVISALVVLIVIFSTGWVVTSNTAKEKAEEMAEQAVIDRLADISIAQFQKDPQKEKRLKEFKATDSWKRAEYVEKIGWATMPGDKSADRRVASETARRLMEID